MNEARDVRVLVVDDDPKMVDILAKHLDRLGYAVATATGGAEALLLVEQGLRPDVVLADIRMPGMDGRTLMTELLRRVGEVRVVLMTAFGAISDAVEAMREGAYWYLTKPFKVEEAAVVLRHATAELTMGRRLQRLERTVRDLYRPERYLGRSERAQATRRDMLRAAELRTVVLVTGETGSGKELAAHIIHASGPRANGPFVPVNCSAIPETLFESELFGHKRGAFTGAAQDSPGLVEEAEGGTLFLDEVGELPLSQQPKLLRLLEEGEVRRVGERLARKVDVRVIAATNRSLEALVRAGQFRQDLFYRLAALVLPLPTLAERSEDIPLLAEALLVEVAHAAGVRAKGFTAAALARLGRYAWPGNVRELRNAIEQALFRARGPTIDEENLPGWLTLRTAPASEPSGARDASTLATLDEIERAHIERVLGETGWNRSRAAEILGIDRRTLFTRVQRYGLVGPT